MVVTRGCGAVQWKREAPRPADLSSGRRLGSGLGGGWRARGGEWVGPRGAREGERAKWVERELGVALSSRPVAHRGRGARVAAAMAREARREGEGLSTAPVGVDWGSRKREEERGKAPVLARVRPCIGRAGRLWARAAGGEREGETRGPARWRVADVEAPRLAQVGGSRRPGDAVSTLGCSTTCSRACKRPASAAFCAHPRADLCLASAGGMGKS